MKKPEKVMENMLIRKVKSSILALSTVCTVYRFNFEYSFPHSVPSSHSNLALRVLDRRYLFRSVIISLRFCLF